MKLSNFRDADEKVCLATVDVEKPKGILWWKKTVEPKLIRRGEPGLFWRFVDTGDYTPGLQAEVLADRYIDYKKEDLTLASNALGEISMQQFKAMKFNIGDNQKLSREIQKFLHISGYSHVGVKGPIKLSSRFIYADEDGKIWFSDSKEDFDMSTYNKEIDIEWMKPMRNTVVIAGKEYFEDEILEALFSNNTLKL